MRVQPAGLYKSYKLQTKPIRTDANIRLMSLQEIFTNEVGFNVIMPIISTQVL